MFFSNSFKGMLALQIKEEPIETPAGASLITSSEVTYQIDPLDTVTAKVKKPTPDMYEVLTINRETWHKCNFCKRKIKDKYSMRNHIIRIHTEPTFDPCKYCGAKFKHKLMLDKHENACFQLIKFKAKTAKQKQAKK